METEKLNADPKPQTYVDFKGQKVWFVGYAADKPYEDNAPRDVVISQHGGLGMAPYDSLKVWKGPRSAVACLNDIFNKCGEMANFGPLTHATLTGIQEIKEMAARGLGLRE